MPCENLDEDLLLANNSFPSSLKRWYYRLMFLTFLAVADLNCCSAIRVPTGSSSNFLQHFFDALVNDMKTTKGLHHHLFLFHLYFPYFFLIFIFEVCCRLIKSDAVPSFFCSKFVYLRPIHTKRIIGTRLAADYTNPSLYTNNDNTKQDYR